jgi:invasion protein IalB
MTVRTGEIRFLGEIENSTAATAKLVRKLAGKYERLTSSSLAAPNAASSRVAKHASWSVTCQLEREMAYFDYGAAAELSKAIGRRFKIATRWV